MKKLFGIYIFKVITIGGLLLLQLLLLLSCSCYLFCCFPICRLIIWLLAVGTALRVAVLPCNIPCRIGWIIGILALPAVFIPLYLILGRGGSIRKIKKFMCKEKIIPIKENEISAPPHIAKQFYALKKTGGFPYSDNSLCTYYPTGEAMYSGIKEIIKKAEKYIFMEFFIINMGFMWGEILEILKEKAKQGVKIYILRDELGTICHLPKDYNKKLKEMGIECRIFNTLSPKIKPDINYRDHRKIVVSDGIYAITGGANIADEYINRISPYGYWKDTAVYISGESAWYFSQMFIQLWNMNGGKLDIKDFITCQFPENTRNTGITQPFGDYPSCRMGFSETVFINMITN
ncbi:MAG: phospholipase D-like domain-containing protein, partial [Hominimerdicola sp.]